MKGGRWPDVPWDPNTFGRYNGDGYLVYPGADGVPYPSLRLAALRDGFEDYEYMWLLRQLVQKAETTGKHGAALGPAKQLLEMDELITDDGAYAMQMGSYMAFREKVARSIVALNKLTGER
jgi:hypothetical protein